MHWLKLRVSTSLTLPFFTRGWARACCEDTLEWERSLGGVGKSLGSIQAIRQRAANRNPSMTEEKSSAVDDVQQDGGIQHDDIVQKGKTKRYRYRVRKEFNRQNQSFIDFFHVLCLECRSKG